PVVIYSASLENGAVSSIWISDNITRIAGYARDSTLSMEWWAEHVHPDDLEHLDIAAILPQGHATRKFRFRFADGSYHWIRDEIHVVYDSCGAAVELVGAWADITDQQRAAEV